MTCRTKNGVYKVMPKTHNFINILIKKRVTTVRCVDGLSS